MSGTVSTRAIWATYLALMVLLGITWVSAYLDLGLWNVAINLGVAALKAGLIIAFFMGLRVASRLVVAASLVGFATIAILFALGFSDWLNRPLY
jgi:cytochrome c oxidase subunit 4